MMRKTIIKRIICFFRGFHVWVEVPFIRRDDDTLELKREIFLYDFWLSTPTIRECKYCFIREISYR